MARWSKAKIGIYHKSVLHLLENRFVVYILKQMRYRFAVYFEKSSRLLT